MKTQQKIRLPDLVLLVLAIGICGMTLTYFTFHKVYGTFEKAMQTWFQE